MSLDCIEVQQQLGCWTNSSGVSVSVKIVTEYRKGTDGELVAYKTRYLDSADNVLTIPAGDVVTLGECCGNCTPQEIDGCANNVPYKQLVYINGSTVTTKYLNLSTGAVSSTAPAGFTAGLCSDVEQDTRTCYAAGADIYTRIVAGGVVTFLKNGTRLTAAADIAVAQTVVDNATFETIVNCVEEQDSQVCYSKTTTTTGTAQSPATGTTIVPMAVVSGAWGTVTSDMSMFGSSTDPASTFTAPWVVVSGTPSFIRDDNGGGIGSTEKHVRLDQGDAFGATLQAYQGVQYRVNDGIFRKVDDTVAGATTIRISARSPSGVTTVIKSISSTRVGGSSGWDGFGSDVVFTATETGTYTVIFENISAVPLRTLAEQIIVNNASGEVISTVSTTVYYRKVIQNGVETWYDANGNVLSTPPDVSTFTIATCPDCVCTLNVLTTVQPTPTTTGNTTNLNSTFKDAAGDTWIVDLNGDAIKVDGADITCQALMDTETFTATAGQTSFTLAQTPSGDVRFSRNGAALADAAATVTGNTVTYVPSANSNFAMVAGDRVEITYVYNVCTNAANPTIVDGSETKVVAGTGVTVTGTGTVGNPYVVSATSTPNGETVYINTTNPATATIFDLNNPPAVNDATLKQSDDNIYVGTDGSLWTYNTATGLYTTYVPTTVRWRARSNGGFTPAINTVTDVTNWATPIHNTHPTAWNATTREFTVPIAGYYRVSGQFVEGGSWAAGDYLQLAVAVNGSTAAAWQERVEASVGTNIRVTGYAEIYMAAGAKVKFQVLSARANAVSSNSLLNEFAISLM